MAWHNWWTITHCVLLGTCHPYCTVEKLLPDARCRRFSASFSPGSRGSLYLVRCLVMLGPTLSSSSSYIWRHEWEVPEDSLIFISQFNHKLVINAKLTPTSNPRFYPDCMSHSTPSVSSILNCQL